MTKLLYLLPILLLATLVAKADFVPGRIRVDAKGDLNASVATGVFKSVDRAIVLQEFTDGVGVTGYMLLTPKGEVHFQLKQTRSSRCGPVYTAQSDSEEGITMLLRDSVAKTKCRLPAEWTIEFNKGSKSRLVLEGAPRRYFLTDGGDQK